MHFDEAAGVLLDADGEPLFRTGERVRVKGSVVEVHGDPFAVFLHGEHAGRGDRPVVTSVSTSV